MDNIRLQSYYFFIFSQDPGQRQFFSQEFEIGEDEINTLDRSGETKNHLTHLVLVVSNFHFNKKAQTTHQNLTCTPLDCYVSLKYSSTKFKPSIADQAAAAAAAAAAPQNDHQDVRSVAGGSKYYFDSHYVFLDYQAFTTLVTDGYLVEHFWPKVKVNFENATGLPLEIRDFLQIVLGDENDFARAVQQSQNSSAVNFKPPKKRKAQLLESSDEEASEEVFHLDVEEVADTEAEGDNDEEDDDDDDDDDDDSASAKKKKRPQSLAVASTAIPEKKATPTKKKPAASGRGGKKIAK